MRSVLELKATPATVAPVAAPQKVSKTTEDLRTELQQASAIRESFMYWEL